MTTSLFQEVVEAIRQQYTALRADGETDLPDLTNGAGRKHWCVGRIETVAHKTPPYVCWVRGGGDIGPVTMHGPIIADDISLSPLYAAPCAVSCVIAGRNERETELLWYAILRSVRAQLQTSAGPGAFRWLTQEEDEAGLVNAGVEVVLQDFVWPFIVPNEVKRTAVILMTSHTDQFHGEAGGTHTDGTHE